MKRLFLLLLFPLLTVTAALAQTITVGNVDPGPYGQGSTIAVPISINDAAGCIGQTNTFNLYLSDASGNFAPGTLIGSYTGFYTPFVNGKIPNVPAGAGYKVMVTSTTPPVSSAPSAAFTINGSASITASVTSQELNPTYPEIFGQCIGEPNSQFTFSNTPVAGTTETASFFNEMTQAFEATNVPITAAGYTFTANTANYTVIVKAVDASGNVGTHDYQLINNLINTSIGSTGTPYVCLVNGVGDLTFNIDISSALGIQFNYPGDTYLVTWGDGTTSTYTFCQIKAANGQVTHTFTLPSCGHIANGHVNSVEIDFQPQSSICGAIGAAPSNYAKILITPITSFTAPAIACVGNAITIPNTSDPGPDPLGTSNTCANNPNALYTWYLDGVIVASNYLLSQPYILPANTPAGTHVIKLHSQTTGGGCVSADYSQTICLENPPKPAFTIPSEICISAAPVSPTNSSVVDNTCAVPQYVWTVTGPAPVNYAGGTNSGSAVPQFVFTAPGVYQVQLGVVSAGCGTITAPAQTIIVDGNPVASLSPNVTFCGNNLTLTFDPTAGATQTILTGSAQAQATTYTWTITGGAYSFQGGTNANSQYPQILFTDFAGYTIKVTHQNSCGTVSATQVITFVQAPTVVAGNPQTVCAGSPVASLAGTVTGTYTSYQWVGGNGTFSAGRNALVTNYTPTAAEINAGTVTLTLQANTALPAPCNIVTSKVTINITPTAIVTSPPTASVCSGQPFNYTITANLPGTTFAWTASLTSGTATGFTASGTSNSINDVLTNPGNTNAVVTYQIAPTFNNCPGTVFNLVVTVNPLPVITAVPVNTPICSDQPANITLTSNVANTSYTWTSTATPGITGNTNQAPPVVTTAIQEVLTNSSTTPGTVTYTVTPYNGTCPGTPVIATITVEPTPLQSIPGPDNEVCNVTTYTLQGNNPAPGTGKWTVTKGPAGVVFSDDTKPNAVVTGLIPGNLYQFQWTITASPTCPSNSNAVNITIDQAPIGGTTSSPAAVCSGSNAGQITLTGQLGTVVRWESSIDNGSTWQPITNLSTTQIYLNLTQTTEYRAIVQNGICSPVPSTATVITVNPLTVNANAGPDDEVCNAITYTLQGNNPAPGTGLWTVTQGPAGAVFSDDTNPNAVVSGLIPGSVYQFQWTITGSATCPTTKSFVNITIDKAPTAGTTTTNPTTVCSGSNGGQIVLTGQFGNILRWESSLDNGASWQPIANTGTTQSYLNLTQTTEYRAVLATTAKCGNVPSSVTIITVNPVTVTSAPGPDDEVCSVTTYTLQGNNPAPGTGKWTVFKGPAGVTFSDDTQPNAVASGLIPGNVYQFQWTITGAAPCPPSSNVVTITIDKAPIGGTTSTSASVCSGSNAGQITLAGQFGNIIRWESSIDNGGTWQPIANTSTTQAYLNLTQTTQYRAILQIAGKCGPVPSSITVITVNPVTVLSVPGPDDEICSITTYTLQGNNPAPGTGKWTVVKGPAGATFSDDTNPNAVVTGLIPGNAYQFQWTITGSPSCPPSSNLVTITIDKTPVGGTLSANPNTVCNGSNAGQILLAGQFGNILRWESSVDNGATWQPIANTSTTQSYLNLTQTTLYRVILQNGKCNTVTSPVSTVVVNPQTPIANAGPGYDICNLTTITLNGNNPAPFSGLWTQTAGPAVAIANPTNFQTQVTGLSKGNVYTFQWTIKGLPPCGDTQSSITIGAYADVIPSFTMDQSHGCGPTMVTFTNTSTPAPDGTFVWDFGDGSPTVTAVNPPTHSFAPSPDGKEITYTITMTPTSNCKSQAPFLGYVSVSPQTPIAKLFPNQTSACGAFVLVAKNLSPGNNVQYDFYLVDQNGNTVQHLQYPDTRDAVFQSINPTQPVTYSVYVVATDKCNNQAKSTPIFISLSPSTLISDIQIKGNVESVCLGSSVTFQNISSGGNRFTITVYDANKNVVLTLPAGVNDVNYTPTAIGLYYVSIVAGNDGCGDAPASALKQFNVYPIPEPNFTFTTDNNYNLTINNTTPNAGDIPAQSINYVWSFGDGSANETSYDPSVHHFDFNKSPFTITLTATTPGTTCSNVISKSLSIQFTGNVFVPNAFIPDSSDPELKIFRAKGSGMKEWDMQIFNNFGEMVWESKKLDSNGAPVEGWDGTFKGIPVQQGVYVWQIKATFINGEDWKGMSYFHSAPRTVGPIHLIR